MPATAAVPAVDPAVLNRMGDLGASMTYTLASASGLAFGFYAFLAISAAIAFAIYVLLTKASVRRPDWGLPTVRKLVAAPFAVLVWITLFSALYLSSLAGFHTVTVGELDIRMEYAVPRGTAALRYAEIGDVIRRPAYKMQWRLEIYTTTGNRFESAAGSYAAIKEAAAAVERRRQP